MTVQGTTSIPTDIPPTTGGILGSQPVQVHAVSRDALNTLANIVTQLGNIARTFGASYIAPGSNNAFTGSNSFAGPTSFVGTIAATGPVSFSSTVTATGPVTFGSSATHAGPELFEGTATFATTAIFQAPLVLPSYTVAGLPTAAPAGAMAYASNGRKPGQGASAGTGIPVWFDVSNNWFSVSSGAQVTS